MKILHIVSGTIIEADITNNTFNYLFYLPVEKLCRNDKEWERTRRFIDIIDKYKLYDSSDQSYYRDVDAIRKNMCRDEFEILDD
ncbi:MAG: hypothetical protein JHC33_02160 [Ignisphaera sp.]|nr:hypothetical protein [Ignisphaera sp.]